MNYILTLKGHFENLTSGQGNDLIGSCCISVDPYGRPEHIYGVIALGDLHQKLLPKTAGDLSPANDLGDMAMSH